MGSRQRCAKLSHVSNYEPKCLNLEENYLHPDLTKFLREYLDQLSAKGRFFHVCMCEKVTFGNMSRDDLFMTI